ncbi:DUF4238 domain-containing protein [Aeromonas caviae]|uniref:DUF4238 domain-containing protein n=1 Tax=Aeromonas caviae TaxID=648 RepID=UPI00111B3564|nr:DUF4238 domain-containing protein [Aeromonas caviae]MCE9860341.1 DUF4238 domain-containing protein [Aeromonas caviae]MDX7864323.1 DUF4238 domain-containing protein [Aeromonas caviae]
MTSDAKKSQKSGRAIQHFVPRVLLKQFTDENLMDINFMRVSNGEITRSIPYKPQCAKKFFYGKELSIENKLGELEGNFGRVIRTLKNINEPNVERYSLAHIYLTIFSVYQYVRTEKALDVTNDILTKSFSVLKEKSKSELLPKLLEVANGECTESEILEFYESITVSMDNPHTILFGTANEIIPEILDLNFKIIKNTSPLPFICSDNPLIYMHDGSTDCFFRLMLPLTPDLLLVFYNGKRYKIGLRKYNFHKLTNVDDIYHINAIQYLNSHKNIYFNSKVPPRHVMELQSKFKKLKPQEETTLVELNGLPFLKSNRPVINYKFSFVKKLR